MWYRDIFFIGLLHTPFHLLQIHPLISGYRAISYQIGIIDKYIYDKIGYDTHEWVLVISWWEMFFDYSWEYLVSITSNQHSPLNTSHKCRILKFYMTVSHDIYHKVFYYINLCVLNLKRFRNFMVIYCKTHIQVAIVSVAWWLKTSMEASYFTTLCYVRHLFAFLN